MNPRARIYAHHFDGDSWVSTRFSHNSERVYEALLAAVVALRSTARDLDRMGATHERNIALDQANLIQEALS